MVSGNEGTTEEGLFIVFFLCMSVCLVFTTGKKIVLIKYSGYRNIGNKVVRVVISFSTLNCAHVLRVSYCTGKKKKKTVF